MVHHSMRVCVFSLFEPVAKIQFPGLALIEVGTVCRVRVIKDGGGKRIIGAKTVDF